MNNLEDSTINALISLLDDSDNEVVAHVTSKLLDAGLDIVSALESAWEVSDNKLQQLRLEELIHKIQFEDTYQKMAAWAATPKPNLLEGFILVSKYQYPDLDEVWIRNQIKTIRINVWLEMNYYLTALERVRILNHLFFSSMGFSGNVDQYNDPNNSYLNKVLETKKGNPISLCVLYSIIAQELGIPIYGVNLPQHFILAYVDDAEAVANIPLEKRPVLFYINAFNKGMIFNRKEIDQFLKLIHLTPNEKYYHPGNNIEIIARMLTNLINSYTELNKPEKAAELTRLKALLVVG